MDSDEDFSAARVRLHGVRPSGFEPETCGLRVRYRGVQSVPQRLLSCGYVLPSSMELGVS